MELVSPNTKNFLFLTMSQFNDTNEMQRARVSMRRDQSFWQGGNSFLACEGFRISASPNPGGLYYKRVTDNYFMGVEEQQYRDAAVHDLTISRAENAGAPAPYARMRATIRSEDSNIVVAGTASDFQLMLGICTPTDTGALCDVADAALTNLAWDNFQQHIAMADTVAVSFTNGHTQLFSIKERGPITGPGGGPSFDLLMQTHDDTVFNDAAKVGLNNWQHAAPFDMDLRMGGKCDLDVLRRALGRGGGISPTTHVTHANGDYVHTKLGGPGINKLPFFQVMGPTNLVLVGEPADFRDANGKQTRAAFWEDLVIGGWVHLGTPTGPRYKVKSFTPFFSNVFSDRFNFTACVRTDVAAFGELKNLKPVTVPPENDLDYYKRVFNQGAVLHFLNTYWEAPIGQYRQTLEVRSVDADGAEQAIDLRTLSGALVNTDPRGIVGVTRASWSKVRRIMRTADIDHYFYTPNEFFEFFNRSPSEDGGPYNLNTDTNGGFVVEWKGDASHNNFIISEEMCLALGLSGYFEYAQVTEHNTGPGWQYRLQNADRTHETANANPVDAVIPGKQLSAAKGGVPLDPDADAADPEKHAVPFFLWSASGEKYVVIDRFQQTEQDENYVWTRRYPSIHTNDRGDRFYLFHDMPSDPAIMRNDQTVSIESYGTFCEINIVIPNLPFQPMLGSQTDSRILASLRIPFTYGTSNNRTGSVNTTESDYYGDLLFNSDSSRSYLKITTDQQLYDVDVEARLIRRDGTMEVFQIPPTGQFQIKLRFLQTQ